VLIPRAPTSDGSHRGGCGAAWALRARAPRACRKRAGAAAVAALGAITLTACGAVGASSTSVSTAASTATRPAQAHQATGSSQLASAPCSSAQLELSYAGTQGATGHLEATFRLRDVSHRSCTLHGYPGAELLNATGHTIPTHLERGHGFFPDTLLVPRQVLLQPGTSAQFGLGFADNNEYVGGRPCPSAAWLKSVPPNASGPLRIALTGSAHPRFAPCGGQLVASPVYAG